MSPPRLESYLDEHVWVAMRRFDAERRAPRPAVVHDHATLALYLSGRMSFWMQGHYEVAPGDLLLVPGGVPHFVVEAQEAEAVGLSVCLSCVSEPAREVLLAAFDDVRRGGCALRRVPSTSLARVEQLFRDLGAELERAGDRGHSAERDLAVEGYLALLAVAVQRAGPGRPSAAQRGTHPMVADALAFIHRHAREGISLREVASHVSRSPAHVASVVKRATGETVVGWITRARLTEARRLLAATDASIEVVAERCGFQSPSHFHRTFKRALGTPPGAWRRLHR